MWACQPQNLVAGSEGPWAMLCLATAPPLGLQNTSGCICTTAQAVPTQVSSRIATELLTAGNTFPRCYRSRFEYNPMPSNSHCRFAIIVKHESVTFILSNTWSLFCLSYLQKRLLLSAPSGGKQGVRTQKKSEESKESSAFLRESLEWCRQEESLHYQIHC